MAFRAASATAGSVGSGALTSVLTMPAGTVASDHVLIALVTATSTANTITLTSSATGFAFGVVVDYRPAANSSWGLWEATGLVAGDTVTLAVSSQTARFLQAFVFTADIGAPGPIFTRSGSVATTAAPGRSINAGAKMLVFSTERTTAAPTTIVSATMSTGETVTQLSYQEGTGLGDGSLYLGEYTAASINPGTATVTYSGASGNGASIQIVEVAGTEAVPAVTVPFGGQSGVFSAGTSIPGTPGGFKSAGPVVTSVGELTLPVPAGTLASDTVYVFTAWGNSSIKTVTVAEPAAKLAGVVTVIPSRHDGNVGWNIQSFTGLTAGDVIKLVITDGTAGNTSAKLFVFDQLLSPPGPVGSRVGAVTTTTIPSVGLVAATPVYLFATERTLTDGTTVTNAVNDSGFPVAQRAYEEVPGDPDVSFYLGSLTPSTTISGATTLTWSAAASSANSGGVAVPASGAVANCQPIFGSQKGFFSIAVKALTDGLLRTNLGRPNSDTVRVKVRVQGPGNVRLAVAATAAMAAPVYSSAVTPDADGYAALSVSGLTADTPYWYQIEFNGSLTGTVNATRTWPEPRTPAPAVAIIVGSCTKGFGSLNGPSNPATFSRMSTRVDSKGNKARLWVDLGDDFYPHSGTSPLGPVFPESEIAVRNYWEAQHGQSQRTAFHKIIPTAHTYSDNDFTGSNSDSTIAPAVAAVVNKVRRQVLSDGPFGSSDGKGLYWADLLGRVLIVHTDSRTYLSNALAPLSDTSKTMLGSTQKQWLKTQLIREDAAAIIWCHDNQWIGPQGVSSQRPALDNWQAYPLERQELADYITTQQVPLLAYCQGDNHLMAFDDGTNNPFGHFPTVITAPVYQDAQTWGYTASGGSWPLTNTGNAMYYCWIEITDDGTNIVARFDLVDATGATDVVRLTHTSVVAAQRPATWLKHEFYANVMLEDIVPQPSPDGGIVGPAGPPGAPGQQGPAGAPGTPGTVWWNGVGPPSPAPVGSKPGDYYLNTTNGDVYVLT